MVVAIVVAILCLFILAVMAPLFGVDYEPPEYLGEPDPNCQRCNGSGLYESVEGKMIDCPCRTIHDFDD